VAMPKPLGLAVVSFCCCRSSRFRVPRQRRPELMRASERNCRCTRKTSWSLPASDQTRRPVSDFVFDAHRADPLREITAAWIDAICRTIRVSGRKDRRRHCILLQSQE